MTLPPGTPDLDVLDLLVSVAEFASLGAAARHHGITQPAASMRISALERRLRLRLLDRGPTGSQLTDAGRAVVAHALPVLAAARSFVEGVTALHTADVARLRVAASKTIADHRIPQWLAALRTTCPDVTVALEVENTRQVEVLVRDGAADLGFVEGPHSPRGLDSRVIGADELVVVVSCGACVGESAQDGDTARTRLHRAAVARTRIGDAGNRVGGPQRGVPTGRTGSRTRVRYRHHRGRLQRCRAAWVLSRPIAAPMLSTGALVEVRLAIPVALTRKFRVIWRRQSPPSGPAEFLVRHALRVDSTSPSNW